MFGLKASTLARSCAKSSSRSSNAALAPKRLRLLSDSGLLASAASIASNASSSLSFINSSCACTSSARADVGLIARARSRAEPSPLTLAIPTSAGTYREFTASASSKERCASAELYFSRNRFPHKTCASRFVGSKRVASVNRLLASWNSPSSQLARATMAVSSEEKTRPSV